MLVFVMSTLTIFSQVSNDTTKVINLNSIEVTGVRTSSLAPISQKTISKLDISKDYHGQEMTYVLEKTPSVTTQSDGGQPNGYTYFRIRGIDQTRINATMNGAPLNESEDQGAYYSNYPGFATYIKSIQVQRGVGSSSNGTASYGGSISYETKDGLDKGFDGNLTVGSFNTKQLNVSYGSGLKNKTAYFVGLSTYGTDGYRYHSDGDGSSMFLSIGRYDTNDVLKLNAFTGYSNNQMAWYPTLESNIKIDRQTNELLKDEVDNFKQSMVQLQYTHSFNEKSILSANVYFNALNGTYGVMLPNDSISYWYGVPTDTEKSYDIFNYNLNSSFFGGFVNYRIIFNKFDINTGIHINTYERTHRGIGIINDVESYNNTGYKKEISGYLKTKYTNNNLSLFGDLQIRKTIFNYKQTTSYTTQNLVDTLSVDFGTFINPMFGATYNLSNKDKVYTSFGLTHREPTRIDMFGGYDDYFALNNIKTETVIDYELGYKLNTSKLNLNTNFYFMYFNNQYLPTGVYNTGGLMIMEPVDKSYRMGIEFDGTYKITDNLSTSNSTTLSNNKILSNGYNHVLYSPSIVLNQNVNYKIKNFDVNLSVRYLSDSYINLNDNSAVCPAYATLNGKVGYTFNKFNISLTCINITDTKYYTMGIIDDKGLKRYFVGVPISFYTTVKFNL